jgi:hypothetical protein
MIRSKKTNIFGREGGRLNSRRTTFGCQPVVLFGTRKFTRRIATGLQEMILCGDFSPLAKDGSVPQCSITH